MPCSGNNHSASCDCGWGGMWHGNIPYGGGGRFLCDSDPSLPRAESIHKLTRSDRPRSLTIPNAKCPVCGCEVFYYENEYGSRVFFDDLGPPWPKHPCTDNSWYASPASGRIAASRSTEEPRWRRVVAARGWQPLAPEWLPCIIYPSKEPRVILKEYDADTFYRLALSPDKLSSIFPVVYIREASKRELKLSYFHEGIQSDRMMTVAFERVVPRKKAAAQASSVGQLPFDAVFLTSVDALELSVRSANCLKNDNIVYVGELVQKTEAEMLRTPNFGRKSLNEIKEVLAQMGLHLGMDVPGWPPENLEAEAYAAGLSVSTP